MERKVKHSYDFKLHCVEEVLRGRSAISVASEFGCDRSQVWKWVVLYKRGGASGLVPRSNRRYDVDFKLKVLKAVEKKSLTLDEACIKFDISCGSVIRSWQRAFTEKGTAGLQGRTKDSPELMAFKRRLKTSAESSTKEELLLENESLRAEIALLKKLQALIQAEESKKRKP
ncbi:helix-turn-helix domain-containing protein [Flavobacterium sp.]|uniref:helix-turn-helix domain-containing protein n=1 Tax=Flavobacterium sp. TaxID=239 RepID=UPI001218ABDE|nr:helix-turn-helix domain-containing protein [Flavobacterium sp.]RZJ73776.1 MAG: DUF1153 domain-containing protein [Flavobacterium sp.]